VKHIFLVRHGAIDRHRLLSEEGKQQISDICVDIAQRAQGDTRIVTSTAPRAIDSAQIIKRRLGLMNHILEPFLWSYDGPRDENNYTTNQNKTELLNVVKKHDDIDTLIVVGHVEILRDLPGLVLKEYLDQFEHTWDIQTGGCIHIRLEDKKWKVLTPSMSLGSS